MSAFACVQDLRASYFSILHIIHFELLSVSKMLEYLTVFISYSYFHFTTSAEIYFLFYFSVPFTSAAHTYLLTAVTQHITTALYYQRFSFYQRFRNLFSSFIINALNCSPGNIHIPATFFLRKAFFIY